MDDAERDRVRSAFLAEIESWAQTDNVIGRQPVRGTLLDSVAKVATQMTGEPYIAQVALDGETVTLTPAFNRRGINGAV